MAKSLKDILNGSKSSKKEKLDLSKLHDYGKGSGKQFIDKHEVEKHDDRAGNDDDLYKGKTKEAKYNKQSETAYESFGQNNDECNHTPSGTHCPVHENDDCSCGDSPKKKLLLDKKKKVAEQVVNEISKGKLKNYVDDAEYDKDDQEHQIKQAKDNKLVNKAERLEKHTNDLRKRTAGLAMAKKKLSKED